MVSIRDRYDRIIDYMRISVTDRCNLRCIYCMPHEGISPLRWKELLNDDEIVRVVKIAAHLGVGKIRITGGEPLMRQDLSRLIESLRNVDGIEDISLTTNGRLLKRYAHSLADAGLNRVNVSLDSLRRDRYREITRGGEIGEVFEGIHEAEKAGLLPIKINMIPIKGVNEDEINEFAMLTLQTPYQVRFIEWMPIGPGNGWKREKYVSTDEIKIRLSAIAPLVPVKMRKSGPARYFRFEDALGIIGFISPISHHFCESCNRLRLTADGKLRPCLFSEAEIDLKPLLRNGAADHEIEKLLKRSVEIKPARHSINSATPYAYAKPMARIGG